MATQIDLVLKMSGVLAARKTTVTFPFAYSRLRGGFFTGSKASAGCYYLEGGLMMRKTRQTHKTAWLVSIVGMMSLSVLWAKDFWEAKPFTQWSEKEALALLSESPWARTQVVLGSVLLEGRSPSSRASDLPPIVGPGQTSGSGISRAGINFSDRDSIPVYVRWYSSRRIRQALGRLGQLQGNAPEEEVNRFVQEPMKDYLICVLAPVMDSFDQVNLENLKNNTFLLSKKDKSKKLQLSNYTAPRDRKDGIALFSFPRTLNGKPVFDLEDEEVQFVTQAKKLGIKASFKISKMMTDGSLDL
jgi:hypothetical protein